jgi:hypothetical protein
MPPDHHATIAPHMNQLPRSRWLRAGLLLGLAYGLAVGILGILVIKAAGGSMSDIPSGILFLLTAPVVIAAYPAIILIVLALSPFALDAFPGWPFWLQMLLSLTLMSAFAFGWIFALLGPGYAQSGRGSRLADPLGSFARLIVGCAGGWTLFFALVLGFLWILGNAGIVEIHW